MIKTNTHTVAAIALAGLLCTTPSARAEGHVAAANAHVTKQQQAGRYEHSWRPGRKAWLWIAATMGAMAVLSAGCR